MRILCYILVVLFVTTSAVGQQINPVPDYIFRNNMSVGRNAPTDTSAYFSIGPRFGATRGFMPPMVVDTAAVTGTKRNGLLIYSIQRNSYLYWDSTGNRWSRLASLSDTVTLSTRAWRQKGIDSLASVRIGGSGVTGYIPKFTAARTLDSSQIFQQGGNIGIGLSSISQKLQVAGNIRANGDLMAYGTGTQGVVDIDGSSFSTVYFRKGGAIQSAIEYGVGNNLVFYSWPSSGTNFDWVFNNAIRQKFTGGTTSYYTSAGTQVFDFTQATATGSSNMNRFSTVNTTGITFETGGSERMRIHSNGRITVNTASDAGYQFDVAGSMRNTTDAYFATSSGNVGIGTTSPSYNFDLVSSSNIAARISSSNTNNNLLIQNRGSLANNQTSTILLTNGPTLIGANDRTYVFKNEIVGANVGNLDINYWSGTTETNRMRIFANGRVGINTTTDAGYQFDVAGSIRNTTDAYFATTSGNVGIGTTSPSYKLDISGSGSGGSYAARIVNTNSGSSQSAEFRAENSSGHSGQMFKNSNGYGTYKTFSNNSFGLYNRGAGNIDILNDVASGTISMTAGAASSPHFYIQSNGEVLINTTSDAGAFQLQVNGVAYAADGLRTGAPAGGTAATWKLGTVASVSPTSPNRTIEVDIGGTIYYIHAKTTND